MTQFSFFMKNLRHSRDFSTESLIEFVFLPKYELRSSFSTLTLDLAFGYG